MSDFHQYTALAAFLASYMHQDVFEDFHSPEDAAAQFVADVGPEEVPDVRREWEELLREFDGRPFDALADALVELGSEWRPATREELDRVVAEFMR